MFINLLTVNQPDRTVVDCIQVVDVEAGIGKFPLESLREEFGPSAVAHEHGSQVVVVDLVDDVVLANFGRCKVRAHVDEGGKASGCHAFQSLQSRGRRIREELQEPCVVGVALHELVQNGQLVLIGQWIGEILIVNAEIVLQSVDQEDDDFALPAKAETASGRVHIFREEILKVLAAAGFLRLEKFSLPHRYRDITNYLIAAQTLTTVHGHEKLIADSSFRSLCPGEEESARENMNARRDDEGQSDQDKQIIEVCHLGVTRNCFTAKLCREQKTECY